MFLHKLKVATTFAALLGAAVAFGLSGLPAQESPNPPVPAATPVGAKAADEKKPQPTPKKPGPGTLLITRKGVYHMLTPDGKKVSEFSTRGGPARRSPDGTRIVYDSSEETGREPTPANLAKPWALKVAVRTLDKTDAEAAWDITAHWLDLCWTADGKRVVVAKHPETDRGKSVENLLLDPETGKTEKLDLPAGAWVLDCGRDGKTLLVAVTNPAAKKTKLGLAAAGDAKVRELADLADRSASTVAGRLSPDGTKILFTQADPERKHAHKWGMSQRPYLLDVKTKKVEPLSEFPENGLVCGIAWSPDGKRVAYTWKQLHEEMLKKDTLSGDDALIETEGFVVVADADGKNPKTIASDKEPNAVNIIYGSIDWR